MTKKELNAREALYGFTSWLTCRKQKLIISANHNAAPVAELVDLYCKTNKLSKVRKNWHKKIKSPVEQPLNTNNQ